MKTNIHRFYIKVLSFLIILNYSFYASAQVKDTVVSKPLNAVNDGYRSLITGKAKTYSSFVQMHQVEDKYYLEIPDSLLGREILTVNRLGRSAADFRSSDSPFGFSGDLIGENLFHFEKGADHKMLIKMKSYKERASDTSVNGMAPSLARNNSESLLQTFTIKVVNEYTHSSVIELTEYLNQDNMLFGFAQQIKVMSGLGMMVNDRSYVESVKGDPDHLFIQMVRTYNKPISKGSSAFAPFTFELNSSMILLPKKIMTARAADKRVPFGQVDYIDFDQNPLGVVNLGNIYRWRLEPADPKAYLEGKLSLPKSPIKMYLDEQIPKKWLSYLAEGILSWNKAFENAGFKNAIEVVMPGNGPDEVYLENANRSGIVFKPGKGNQWGNLICDPRTGEILQVQLNFYLDDLNKLYNQYLIQAGASDPQGRAPVFSTELMGRLLVARTAQQMGTALGLKSNAGASAAVPLTNLRSNSWLNAHSFNGSITDLGLINYAAQPQDGIEAKNLVAKISQSDSWNINWGYRYFPVEENKILNKLIVERAASGLQMYAGEASADNSKILLDPRIQSGDLSDDAIGAGKLGIANLKKVAPNIMSWTLSPGQGYQAAADVYKGLVAQFGTYLRYSMAEIGGVYIDIKNSDQKGDVFRFTPIAKQQRALNFIQQEGFKTPLWLKVPSLYQRTGDDFDLVSKVQKGLLADLLDSRTLSKLMTAQNSGERGYSPSVFLNDLSDGIFAELGQHQLADVHRRELQKLYVNKLIVLVQGMAKSDSDLPSVLRVHAMALMKRLKSAGKSYKGIYASHFSDLYERLYNGLHQTAQSERNNTNPFSIAR